MKSTRSEAARHGMRRYYTGKPCAHGHIAARFTTNGVCTACAADHQRDRRTRLREQLQAADAAR